jgi:uroporphyrinogen decarboxylase
MGFHVTSDHLNRAEAFVKEIKDPNGLAMLDVDRFWKDDKKAHDLIWSEDCPQMPLGIGMSWECPFEELGLKEDWHRIYHDNDYQIDLCQRYNDISEKVVGKRLIGESKPDSVKQWPEIKALHDIFEAKNVWHNESFWLQQSANTEEELSALLDRVESRLDNLRDFILPQNWEKEKERLTRLGCPVPRYRGQRGPVTFAMSVYGVENLIYLIEDEPELAKRFSNAIFRAIKGRAEILDHEAGFTKDTRPSGWSWMDDNCCNLNPEMYEFFAFPIVKGMFDIYSPNPNDRRYQHSDSPMGHHLPLLGTLDMTCVNLGPTLSVNEIREHLPNAVIDGQLAPFTFSRNEEVNMVAELLRDFEMSKEKKGVDFSTAGSINNGSRLSGLRLLMSAIQNLCQY